MWTIATKVVIFYIAQPYLQIKSDSAGCPQHTDIEEEK